MNSTEFKNGIKEIKENLRGLTLQLVHTKGYKPYFTLKEFGIAVLEEEKKGNDFRINQVWTSEGTVGVKSLKQLVEVIKIKNVEAIQFESFYNNETTEGYIRSFGALD